MAWYHKRDVPTPREREVIRLVAQGWTNAQIAAALCISEATVENHLTHLYAKLRVHNRMAAVRAMLHRGWMTLDPQDEGLP